MAALTKDQELGEKWAMENGSHALLNKTVQVSPCGCQPIGAGNLKSPLRIEFCKKHREAFKVIHDIFNLHECPVAENSCKICVILKEQGFHPYA